MPRRHCSGTVNRRPYHLVTLYRTNERIALLPAVLMVPAWPQYNKRYLRVHFPERTGSFYPENFRIE